MKLKRISSIIRTIYIKNFYKINVGDKTYFQGKVDICTEGKIKIGKKCVICPWVCFREYGGFITIGDNCSINSFCHLSGNGGIIIGNNVRIATQCVIISANHNFDNTDVPIYLQGETKSKIVIEDDCWLGAGVKVLAGVTIGRGSVIGAGSVVNKDVPPYSVVVGVPGRVIKNRR